MRKTAAKPRSKRNAVRLRIIRFSDAPPRPATLNRDCQEGRNQSPKFPSFPAIEFAPGL